jgi:inward rectifier potassium channel
MTNNIFNRLKQHQKEFKDSGLSNQVGAQSSRLLGTNGQFRVRREGIPWWEKWSLSHVLTTMPWSWFIPLIILFAFVLNLSFAICYYLMGIEQFAGHVAGNKWEEFTEVFFFSAQTITTVGYGRMNPVGFWPNMVASFESLLGLIVFAVVTGLVYGRFSKAVAHIRFSPHALISPYQDGFALMIRMANSKNHDIAEVEALVLLSLVVYDGQNFVRKYYTLDLERSKVNALALSWTLVHPIREGSPLWEITPELLEENEGEILVTIKGFDTTFSQTVMSRKSYHYSEVIWKAKYKPTFHKSEDGKETVLRLDRLGDYESTEAPIPSFIKA